MKIVKGAVTAPKGFVAGGLYCGLKRKKKDLAIIFSKVAAVASGVFTQNRVKAAPVIYSNALLAKHRAARAVVINSGNANCMTGKTGLRHAQEMARAAAHSLGVDPNGILVLSTGVIGRVMNIKKVVRGIEHLGPALSADSWEDACSAIMTTDRYPKYTAVSVMLSNKKVSIGGIAKGAGMIHPNMATMLCVLTTDAAIDSRLLQHALKESVDQSFNRISVDGDTSTNDSVIILANGLARNKKIREAGKDYRLFVKALSAVCKTLARMIVDDGEGATKILKITVKGAKTPADARRLASYIATSNLIKTMTYGGDPNWGRVAARTGASGVAFKMDRLDIYLGGVRVLKDGRPVSVDRKILRKAFNKKEARIKVDLKAGRYWYQMLSSDLTPEYVRINSAYET